MNITCRELGKIKLNKKVVVSDPCYSYGSDCAVIRKDVMPGEYRVFIRQRDEGEWGNRVSRLMAFHKDFADYFHYQDDDVTALFDYIPSTAECLRGDVIGVDAGCAGIYDHDYFKKNQPDDDYGNTNSWYYRVTNLTNNENGRGGVMDARCGISESGYGDGGYEVSFFRNHKTNEVVGIVIDFGIEDEDDYDEDEYDEDEYDDEDEEEEEEDE